MVHNRLGNLALSASRAVGTAPEAQPYQDLIDRMLCRMAGLTEAEAQGLEKRRAERL
jgi:hypothetical protein